MDDHTTLVLTFMIAEPSPGHPLEFKRPGFYDELQVIQNPRNCRQIYLTHGIGYKLPVWVTPFEPQPEDKTERTFTQNGVEQTLEMHPIGIASTPQLMVEVDKYIRQTKRAYLDTVFPEFDPLTREVFEEAIRFSERNEVSCLAFHFHKPSLIFQQMLTFKIGLDCFSSS